MSRPQDQDDFTGEAEYGAEAWAGATGAGSDELEEEGLPPWLATFGDLMTLLLTFFVLLYSMSEIRVEEFTQASQSLQEAFGSISFLPVEPSASPSVIPLEQPEARISEEIQILPDDMRIFAITDAYLEQIARRLEELIEDNELDEVFSVLRTEDGVRLRILSTTLFDSGSAALDPASIWMIQALGEITTALEAPAVVSGHTDDVPIQTAQFPSNWELSAARAAGVARALVAQGHDTEAIRVEGYGEFRPVVGNDTPEDRAQNRRVEVLFSRDDIMMILRRRLEQGLGIPEAWQVQGS
ncbi:MAG: hypothetical protein EA422_05965 [Gemmatimonadales bacterium]|nr:MAG: hypothetical protein EA422_05965 [Gemmatimonadales bacterium]